MGISGKAEGGAQKPKKEKGGERSAGNDGIATSAAGWKKSNHLPALVIYWEDAWN